jgi:intein/homing endonuclease
LATYTEYGKSQVLRLNPKLIKKLDVIPHGNNSQDFYPLPKDETLAFRKEYFGDNSNKFIVTNINRNQSRKDIPTTIFGFLEYWEEYNKNAFLYLHMNWKDPMGWNLKTILSQTPLREGVDYMFPSEENASKGASVELVNKIYNTCDLFLTTATGEGWGLCLHPSTMITTQSGVKAIPSVKIGDKVLTNDGTYHEVLDTTNRVVDSYISIQCDYGFNINATHEHPYLVMSKDEISWKKFQDVKIGDYLAIIKPKGDNELITRFDLAEFVDAKNGWVIEEYQIYHKNGFKPINDKWSYSNIIANYNTTKSIIEDAFAIIRGEKKKGVKSTNLAKRLVEDGCKIVSKISKVNRYISVNEDLLWFIGLYLADGSSENNKRVEFSLNTTTKKEYANRVKNIAETYFGVNDVVIRVIKNKLGVRISSVLMATFLTEICGHKALNKRIPPQFIGSEKMLMPLVNGFFNGDGHVNLSNDVINFTTISPSLAYQIQSVLNSNEIFISITSSKRISNIYTGTIPTSHCKKYMDIVEMKGVLDRENKRNHIANFKENNTHFFVKVKSISEINNKTEMYDLCVADSHTFTGNGIVCHNTITEAMSSKLPILAPNHTSIKEICDSGKRAYMLDTLYPIVAQVDNIIRFQTDLYEIAENINFIKEEKDKNSELYQKRVDDAYDYVSSLKWSDIAKKFIKAINRLTKD